MADQTYGQYWAQVVRDGPSDRGVIGIISAVNLVTGSRQANQADVIVASAQLLGRSIAPAGRPEIAREVRDAVMAMIDGYTFQVAVETTR
jgi:hypothetical protein